MTNLKPIIEGNISKMGLGLAALGRPGYINLGHSDDLSQDYDEIKMEAQTHLMLDAAYNQGIRYFDTAQSYGKAESFLSTWLTKRKPQGVTVGSKWGYYYTAGWRINADKHEIKEHTIARLNKQWPESKNRLDPFLKLYQIHSATFESGVLENTLVLERLEEIKSEGYKIGLSVSGPGQPEVIQAALKVEINKVPLFNSVQTTYNILEQSAERALQKTHDNGVDVIIKEGVANGRLTARNNKATYFNQLKRIADKYGVGTDTISLTFLLAKPFISMVLSGAAVENHLISNLKASEIALDKSDIATLDQMKISSASYWKERGSLAWN